MADSRDGASFDAIHKALAFVRQGEYEDLARWCEVKRKEAIIRAKAGEDYARLEKMGISVDLDRFQFDL